jgi:hypothetical protein
MTVRGRRRRGRAAAAATAVLVAAALGAAAVGPPAAAAQATGARATGIWISPAELRRLPERGAAWDALKEMADDHMGHARLAGKDDDHDVHVLAAALVFARTGEERYRRKAEAGVMDAIGSEQGGRTLGLGRGLISYVIAADLIDLRQADPGKEENFRRWLAQVRFEKLRPSGRPTLVATHEAAANNWGTLAGASRIAADVYLGDRADLARAAAVFKGWLGDRAAYDRFSFGKDDSWQADPDAPVAVLPAGATKDGHAIGGALPDDMRRGCSFRFPPCPTGYPWEAMQGAVMQAELLSRQGYDAWNWQNRALRRAAEFLYTLARRSPKGGWAAHGNDRWVTWVLNRRYGTHFQTSAPTEPGRGMGFTDWTHGAGSRCPRRGCAGARGPSRTVAAVTDGPLGLERRSGGDAKAAAAVGGLAVTLFAVAGALLFRILRVT